MNTFYFICGAICVLLSVFLFPTVKPFSRKKMLVLSVFVLAFTGGVFALYARYGTPNAIEYSQRPLVAEELKKAKVLRPLLAKFKHKTAELEAQLEMDANQPAKWWELSQIYQLQRREEDAFAALEKAYQLQPENINLALEFASLAARKSEGLLTLQARQIVDQAYNHPSQRTLAVNLLAMDAYQKGEYVQAMQHWQEVVALLEATHDNQENVAKVEATIQQIKPKAQVVESPQIILEISLAEELKGQVEPDDLVFIYAKNPQAPQPLAVVRRRAFELPCKVTLGPQHAMLEHWALNRVKGANFEARIAKSGTPEATAGDLWGKTAYVEHINADGADKNPLQKTITISQKLTQEDLAKK